MRRRSAFRPLLALRDTASPVFVVDARRQIVFFNHGCERETGWLAEDVLGHRADYVTESDPHSIAAVAAALAPPPEVWQGRPLDAAIYLPHRTAPVQPRRVYFFPVWDDEQHVTAVWGALTPLAPPPPSPPPSVAQALHAELAALRQALRQQYHERTLVARSPALLRVLGQIRLAQQTPTPALLIGEPGVGKEHIARVIHYGGSTGKQTFVPLDCQRTPVLDLKRTLRHLQEERTAHDPDALLPGTLYFAGIEHAPADVQERLAELLAPEPRTAPLRVIAAAHAPLEPLVAAEQFRADLYYRLTPLTISVPPLRQRPDDLGPLAQLFLEEHNRNADSQVSGFSDDVWIQLRKYNWPGNADELRAVVAEARAACAGPVILPDHLPFRFRTGVDAQKLGPVQRPRPVPLDPLLEQAERDQLELALAEARGNVSQAAELLGINRARFYRRMQQLGLRGGDADEAAEKAAPP